MSEAQIITLFVILIVIGGIVAVFACICSSGDESREEEKRLTALRAKIAYERNCVETALQIKLFDWQVEYIWGSSPVMMLARGSGKTLAYIIKLCLSKGRPLYMYRGGLDEFLCDENHGCRYLKLFRAYTRETYQRLQAQGKLKLRKIYFSEKEVPNGY